MLPIDVSLLVDGTRGYGHKRKAGVLPTYREIREGGIIDQAAIWLEQNDRGSKRPSEARTWAHAIAGQPDQKIEFVEHCRGNILPVIVNASTLHAFDDHLHNP